MNEEYLPVSKKNEMKSKKEKREMRCLIIGE
jgi:hypothetical protein